TLYRRSRRSRDAATISTTDVGPASNPLGRLRGCGTDPGQPPRPHSESAPAQPRPTATTAPNSMRRAHRFSPDHQPGEAAWMTPRPGIAAPPPTTPAPTRNPSDRLHRPPRTGPAACPPTRGPPRATVSPAPETPRRFAHRSPPRQPNARAHPDQRSYARKTPGPPSQPVGKAEHGTALGHTRDCVSEAPASNYSAPRAVTPYGLNEG